MKKNITALLLTVMLLLAFTACSSEYSEFGLHYTLSSDYEQITVPYSQHCYTDGNAYFFFVQFAPAQIEEELGYDPDISVRDYTIKFLNENDLALNIYEYDEERDISVIKYESLADEQFPDDELYYHVVLKGSTGYLYIVTMSCELDMREIYEPEFERQIQEMYVD